MKNIYKIKLPSAIKFEETMELFKNFDDDAREKIINGNLRLVAYIAKRHVSSNVDEEDLFNIATVGLIKAVDTFDLNKSKVFSTYAGKCIENEIRMNFRKEFITTSRKTRTLKKHILDYIDEVYKVTGSEPSKEEIAKRFDVDMMTVYEALNSQTTCSLNDEIDDSKELTREDTIASDINVEETCILNFEKASINSLLSQLDFRERLAVELYYGIGCVGVRQKEISKILEITQSYTSRLIVRGIENMKSASKCDINDEVRIKTIRELFNNASIEEIKDVLISMDENHRNVFMNLHPLNGSIAASFSEIKDLLGLSYKEIYRYDKEAINMIKARIKVRHETNNANGATNFTVADNKMTATIKTKNSGSDVTVKVTNKLKDDLDEEKNMITLKNEQLGENETFYYSLFPFATKEMIEEAVNMNMQKKYKDVFLGAYPVDGSKPLTQFEIAEKFGIPRGSIPYIIKKSIEKISKKLGMEPNKDVIYKRKKTINTSDLTVKNNKENQKILSTKCDKTIENETLLINDDSILILDEDRKKLRPIIRMLADELQETLLLLRLGFIRNRQYSNEEIARFLNMSEEDTRTITCYALLRIKEIGNAISGSSIKIETMIESQEKIKQV